MDLNGLAEVENALRQEKKTVEARSEAIDAQIAACAEFRKVEVVYKSAAKKLGLIVGAPRKLDPPGALKAEIKPADQKTSSKRRKRRIKGHDVLTIQFMARVSIVVRLIIKEGEKFLISKVRGMDYADAGIVCQLLSRVPSPFTLITAKKTTGQTVFKPTATAIEMHKSYKEVAKNEQTVADEALRFIGKTFAEMLSGYVWPYDTKTSTTLLYARADARCDKRIVITPDLPVAANKGKPALEKMVSYLEAQANFPNRDGGKKDSTFTELAAKTASNPALTKSVNVLKSEEN